jgi:hypothetical protein
LSGSRWIACIATVEWHSGSRGNERPVALRVGPERIEVTVEQSWVEGPAVAGSRLRRFFVVSDPQRRRWRLRSDGAGEARVEREEA